MTITHTLIIIGITAVISFVAFSSRQLKAQLIFYPPAIKRGQLYRFITYGLIHADMGHLLFNMFTLYFFGNAIEDLYQPFLGGFGFVAFYVLALIASIIPSYLANINNPAYASLGASGAVSAVLFAYILIAPWNMLYIFGAVPIPAIVFAIGYVIYSLYAQKKAQDNVNHGAHLWGAVFGISATILLYPQLVNRFIKLLLNPPFLG
ncbi:MAG: rhomboid family intramembrane serine protease [Gammaproteobacteria bacterium]|nr:rhomboid family intramembrane serine protease [Gammaproteobacteria bacterium]